jgi:polyisoprenoid-binding protein YceI
VRALGVVAVHGRFSQATGRIDIPHDITCSRVWVTVRSDSFQTGSASYDRWAKSAAFLDTAAHPTLSFRAAGLRPIMDSVVTDEGARPLWWLPGLLSAKDVTGPLRFALGVVRVCDDGSELDFDATARLRRSDFGVTRLRGLIGDVVDVVVRGRAHRRDAG